MNSTLTRILHDSFDELASPKYSIPDFPVVTLGCSIPRGATSYIVPVALSTAISCFKPPSDPEIEIREEVHYIRAFFLRNHREDFTAAPRTVSSLMEHLNRGRDGGLTKVTTSKGYTYYGDSGVIFNDRLEPLLLTAYWVRNMGVPGESLSYRRYNIVLIDPQVLTKKDTLSRAIIRDFIPFYREYDIDVLFTNLRRYVVHTPIENQENLQEGVAVLSDIIAHNL